MRIVKHSPVTLSFGAAETTKTWAFSYFNGYMVSMIVVVPNWTNTVTCTLSIVNGESRAVYTSAALAQNASYYIYPSFPVAVETYTLTATLSGVPGGSGGNVIITAYFEEG